MTIHLVLIDSCDLSLTGMQQIIETDHRMHICAALAEVPAFRQYMGPAPDVVIIGEDALQSDPFQLLDLIQQLAPTARHVLVGRQSEGVVVRDLLYAGLHGYLFAYDALSEVLIYAIDRVIRGQLYLSPTVDSAYLLTMQSKDDTWSPDYVAREILRRLARGYSIGQISVELGLPRQRIYKVRDKLRRRFDAQTNEQLIYRAIAQGYNFPEIL